jgi:PhzF family phenazine biosynthesis protein
VLRMSIPIVQVNAFTSEPFAGNPAAVVVLPGDREAAWMQAVAREMNLSETAFAVGGDDGYALRWFTPSVEVDLCGHATLATAHVLWETGRLAPDDAVRFDTRSGALTAIRRDGWIELDFPATPEERADPPDGLIEALGIMPMYVGKGRFDYLVEVASEEDVRTVCPDFGLLGRLPVRGVIVTSRSSDTRFDFVSRFFAPGVGIDEDPVTGSAHCTLAPFWSRRLRTRTFLARQISSRGGILKVHLEGDRVRLAGQAVTVWRGDLVV